jgi:hypothetical protein
MNPYTASQSLPEPPRRSGIDRRTWALALVSPLIIAFAVALAVGSWLTVVAIGRHLSPTTRAIPLPSPAEQDRQIPEPPRF